MHAVGTVFIETPARIQFAIYGCPNHAFPGLPNGFQAMVLQRSDSSIYEDELRDLLTYDCAITGKRRCPPCMPSRATKVPKKRGNKKDVFLILDNVFHSLNPTTDIT